MRTLSFLALSVFLLPAFARPAAAACTNVSTANEICSPSADPCVVDKAYCIAISSVLDFGARTVNFERRGQLDVGGGGATIRAGKVNLMAVGGPCAIVGAGGDIDIDTTGDVVIGRSGNDAGCVDVSGDPGGSITIDAEGSINLQGVLDAHSTSDLSFAGDVTLTGLQIATDPKAMIDVRGGNQGISGTVSMETTAGMTLRGTISGRANTGAEVDLTALGGDVDVKSATFDLPGSGFLGFAGTVDFDATANIDTTGATFTMTGSQAGDGGTMMLDADGSIVLGGKIQMRGDAADDDAGQSGEIDAFALADIRITATQLDLTGAPNGEAGDAFFDADGDIIQSASIDASGSGPEGSGGHIEFTARHNLTLDAINVSADGGSGDIDGEGFCSLTVPAGRLLRALGPMGTIRLASGGVPTGGGQLTVAGTLQATQSNTLETRFQPPITAGASITPAATIPPLNQLLTPCGGPPRCNDNTLQVEEECDGALGTCDPGQLCVACQCESCGNGQLDQGETCDSTASNNGNCPVGTACSADCTTCQQCGNGNLDAGEQCDGQAGTCPDGFSCNDTCHCSVRCGDGIQGPGEVCDDGNTDDCDGCNKTCTRVDNVCGDDKTECGEVCDDGNTDPCMGSCSATCGRFAGICGDGITECGEAADDGNTQSCDGVSAACEVESCGNGVPECNEQCDDGPAGSLTCTPQCVSIAPPGCGDGVLQADEGEICDDGNNVGCDGCAANCLRLDNVCGDRTVECGEQCDDGGQVPGDGCSPRCQAEICGNGIIDPGEFCDAGARNGQAGSGCSTTCQTLGTCTVDSGTTECVACADYTDCSPLGACGGSVCVAGVCTPTPQPNCDDSNACTADACQPARGCVHTSVADGPATGCDDGDQCTDDACAAGACVNNPRPGAAGATCRLAAFERLVDSASDIPKGTKKKLRGLVKKITKKVPIAAQTGKKADRALKQINNALKAVMRTVTKAQKKIGPATLQGLDAAIDDLMVAAGGL